MERFYSRTGGKHELSRKKLRQMENPPAESTSSTHTLIYLHTHTDTHTCTQTLLTLDSPRTFFFSISPLTELLPLQPHHDLPPSISLSPPPSHTHTHYCFLLFFCDVVFPFFINTFSFPYSHSLSFPPPSPLFSTFSLSRPSPLLSVSFLICINVYSVPGQMYLFRNVEGIKTFLFFPNG